jgi:hypothetical protein
MKVTASDQPLTAKVYVRIVLVGIVVFFILLWIYSRLIPLLAEHGELHFFRYIVLVALGLIGAIILHGVMRSSSAVNYKEQTTSLRVGGPAAVCFFIVWGGAKFVPDTPPTFDVTIRPQSADGEKAIITSGSLLLDLDSDRRSQRLSQNGEADFKQIPWRFRGMTVTVLPRAEGYEERPQTIVLSGSAVTLPLHKRPPSVSILRGSIELPRRKYRNITIFVEGQQSEASPDKFGRFEMKVDGVSGDRVRVKVVIDGNLTYDEFQTLPGPVTLVPHQTR